MQFKTLNVRITKQRKHMLLVHVFYLDIFNGLGTSQTFINFVKWRWSVWMYACFVHLTCRPCAPFYLNKQYNNPNRLGKVHTEVSQFNKSGLKNNKLFNYALFSLLIWLSLHVNFNSG